MDLELLKVIAPYFTSILGTVAAIGIAVYNNSARVKNIDIKLTALNKKIENVDEELNEVKKNHFAHLGGYLKKLNAFLFRGKLMDDVEKADMDIIADGVAGK